jgi:hypothetical protein
MLFHQSTMSRRSALTGILFCLLLTGCGHLKQDTAGAQQNLVAAVPLHSTGAQVVTYLDAQKIRHSTYRRDTEAGNRIEASVLVKRPHAIVNPSYDVIFRFDDHDHLIACDVQYLGYVGL